MFMLYWWKLKTNNLVDKVIQGLSGKKINWEVYPYLLIYGCLFFISYFDIDTTVKYLHTQTFYLYRMTG